MDTHEMARTDDPAKMLALVDQGRQALREARDLFEMVRVRNWGAAIQAAAGILERRDIQVHASVLVQDAERAIAKANPPLDPKQSGSMRNSKDVAAGATPVIPKYTLSKMRAAHAKLSDEEYSHRVQAAYDEQLPLTRKSLGPTYRFESLSGDFEWYTPGWIVGLARDVLDGIDLDPLSSAAANGTVRASRYFTEKDDGFRHAWEGRLWINPPYDSETMAKVVDKLSGSPGVDAGLMLANNSLETKWCQRMLGFSKAHCLLAKRIKFDRPGDSNGGKGSPLVGQTIFAFGEGLDVRRFMETFEKVGFCSLNTQADWRDILDWRQSMALGKAA